MTLNDLLPLIGGLGIGGILGIVVKHFLDRNSELKIKLKAINEEKYRTVLIYMSIILNPRNKDHFVLNDNILYSLTTESDIRDYSISKLNEYYFQSLLYASDDVMKSFKSFLNDPSRENYIISAQKMRIDLWNSKTRLKISEI
ncbi:hypothetical protein [Fluviicola sp.]|uniref:hypothetical protein n=1 Tax=Fluviicola sp. TaxID=1917219 RepID=UPI003D2D71AC